MPFILCRAELRRIPVRVQPLHDDVIVGLHPGDVVLRPLDHLLDRARRGAQVVLVLLSEVLHLRKGDAGEAIWARLKDGKWNSYQCPDEIFRLRGGRSFSKLILHMVYVSAWYSKV